MILFILEGAKREQALLKTINYLYFKNKDSIIFSFNNNIYNLYKEIKSSDFELDIVSLLREKSKSQPNNELNKIQKTSEISEVYLIFDYDGHNQNKNNTIDSAIQDTQIIELLEYFNNENDNGKLYINYPMIESLWYTKTLPDKNYYTYTTDIALGKTFKNSAGKFCDYGNSDFISFKIGKRNKELKIPTDERIKEVMKNWELLKQQNVFKANYICTNQLEMPSSKNIVSQENIFKNQKGKYIANGKIAILSSLALFIYENFR